MSASRCLTLSSLAVLLLREVSARAAIETGRSDRKSHSMGRLSLGLHTLLYVVLASAVVIMVGLLLYCITCIQGTKKRHKPARRYNKPATIIIKPARMKTHQHARVMRPVEPVQPVVLDEYETHSLTMYIPPED